jgi:hypothetical protein
MDFCSIEYGVFVPGELTDIHPSAQAQNMLIQGSKWFTANMKFAADRMVDMFENYGKYTDNAKRQSHYVKANFSYDAMKAKLVAVLEAVPKTVELKLPTLKKVGLP